MAKDPALIGLPVLRDARAHLKRGGRPPRFYGSHDSEWVSLCEQGLSTTRIAKRYQAGASTVSRHLRRYISPKDRVLASIAASTKFPKTPFSGDDREGAYLAGFVEDFHVRKAGRLLELGSSTTHPAMERLFRHVFDAYGHPTSSSGYDPRGYYRYYLYVSLHGSFEPFLTKSEAMPSWVPRAGDSPIVQSYVAGLIAAEGCIRLYNNHGRADAVVHITLKKPVLLRELSSVIGGRLYEVPRAWRLVIYGKQAVEILRRLKVQHEEKVSKSRLVLNHTGEEWSYVEPYWREVVNEISFEVNRYKEQARLDYIRKHGGSHPSENERSGRQHP